jgi:hypothetical protein
MTHTSSPERKFTLAFRQFRCDFVKLSATGARLPALPAFPLDSGSCRLAGFEKSS